MKKMLLLVILVLGLFSLAGCDMPVREKEPYRDYRDVEAVLEDKYTSIESKYNFFLNKYKTYTAYWFVTKYGVTEVKRDEYFKYEIGDKAVVRVLVLIDGNTDEIIGG